MTALSEAHSTLPPTVSSSFPPNQGIVLQDTIPYVSTLPDRLQISHLVSRRSLAFKWCNLIMPTHKPTASPFSGSASPHSTPPPTVSSPLPPNEGTALQDDIPHASTSPDRLQISHLVSKRSLAFKWCNLILPTYKPTVSPFSGLASPQRLSSTDRYGSSVSDQLLSHAEVAFPSIQVEESAISSTGEGFPLIIRTF